ncbi:MAG TPA: PQQ-binding-like beta-propeller repeat protein [Candidatus Hydrogenedentes bacterium]|nr:PQQ-binding-like beta-propeller repeat protein [Candidatus Hydrogenedentota bacterium]
MQKSGWRNIIFLAALLTLTFEGESAPPLFPKVQILALITESDLLDASVMARYLLHSPDKLILKHRAKDFAVLRAAQQAHGIETVFVPAEIASDALLLTDPQARANAVDAIMRVAQSTHDNKLGGLVLLLLEHQETLDSGKYDGVSMFTLAAGARALGEAVGRELRRTTPSLELCLVMPSEDSPLWLECFGGFVETVAHDSLNPIYLLAEADVDSQQYLAQVRDQFRDSTWDAIARHCTVVPLLTSGTSALRAMATSQQAVWCNPASPQFAPIPTELTSPSRVGSLLVGDTLAYVYRDEQGASVAILEGSDKPLDFATSDASVSVVNLLNGERSVVAASNGMARIEPSEVPMLIEHLPLRDWVTPAALWFEPEVPIVSGNSTTPVRFGWINHTGATLSGSLAAVPLGRASIQPDTVSASLAPGETLESRASLRTNTRPNESVSIRLVYAATGMTPVSRTFSIEAMDAPFWRLNTFTKLESRWTAVDFDRDGIEELIGNTANGDMMCVSALNGVLWEAPNHGFLFWPVTGRYWNKKTIVGSVNGDSLVLLDESGERLWHRQLPSEPTAPPLFANLNPKRGEEIVVGMENGAVVAFRSDGNQLWTASVEGPVYRIVRADRNGDSRNDLIVVGGKKRDRISLIDPHGNVVWEETLPGAIDGTPSDTLQTPVHGEVVVVVLEDASVIAITTENGQRVELDESSLQSTSWPAIGNRTLCELDGDSNSEYVIVQGDSVLRAYNW